MHAPIERDGEVHIYVRTRPIPGRLYSTRDSLDHTYGGHRAPTKQIRGKTRVSGVISYPWLPQLLETVVDSR